ncbi:MAG: carboxypeptidase regulatory-like domain-containing protein [Gemmatimonadaceae bacterium]|nr:carboxypeptidase regulatory-like domain-containing protein [Gemmatimonadaceae bacterium]
MPTPPFPLVAALLLATLAVTSPLASQSTGTLAGRVVDDRTEQPIAGVEVTVAALSRSTVTDSLGAFILGDVATGRYLVQLRKLGFQPISASIAVTGANAPRQTLRLVAGTPTLTKVETYASPTDRRLAAFEEHRRGKYGGTFLTADMLEKEAGRPLADVLQPVRGVDIVRGPSGASWFATRRGYDSIRLMPTVTPGDRLKGASAGLCYAAVVINDVFVYRGADGEELFDLNTLQPSRILALEIYRGGSTMPLEYNATRSTCGLLVIYTK